MDKIKTATGREFDCDYFNPSSTFSQVNMHIVNTPLVTVASVFGNPEETKQLFYGKEYLANHTKLKAIIPVGNAIRVVLERM